MSYLFFLTHTDVEIDKNELIEKWPLSEKGKDRFKKINLQSWFSKIDQIFTSEEQKAVDGADIASAYLNKPYTKIKSLGEFDRTSTGYQPYETFMHNVNSFFQYPTKNVCGWESATDAQKRIVKTIADIVMQSSNKDILVISHGAVGALYMSYLLKKTISIIYSQPENNGGNYFIVDSNTNKVIQTWKPLDTYNI